MESILGGGKANIIQLRNLKLFESPEEPIWMKKKIKPVAPKVRFNWSYRFPNPDSVIAVLPVKPVVIAPGSFGLMYIPCLVV